MWVDDLLIAGKHTHEIAKLKSELTAEFEIVDLGENRALFGNADYEDKRCNLDRSGTVYTKCIGTVWNGELQAGVYANSDTDVPCKSKPKTMATMSMKGSTKQ